MTSCMNVLLILMVIAIGSCIAYLSLTSYDVYEVSEGKYIECFSGVRYYIDRYYIPTSPVYNTNGTIQTCKESE